MLGPSCPKELKHRDVLSKLQLIRQLNKEGVLCWLHCIHNSCTGTLLLCLRVVASLSRGCMLQTVFSMHVQHISLWCRSWGQLAGQLGARASACQFLYSHALWPHANSSSFECRCAQTTFLDDGSHCFSIWHNSDHPVSTVICYCTK